MLPLSHVLFLVLLPTHFASPFVPSFLYSPYLSKFLYLHLYIFLFCIPHFSFYFHLLTESLIFFLTLFTHFPLHILSLYIFSSLPSSSFYSSSRNPSPTPSSFYACIYLSFSHSLLSPPVSLQSSSSILSCVLSFLCFSLRLLFCSSSFLTSLQALACVARSVLSLLHPVVSSWDLQNKLAEAVTYVMCVLEVPCSNVSWGTDYLDSGF